LLDSLLQEMDFIRLLKLMMQMGLAMVLVFAHADAWYNATTLEDCDPVQKWDVTKNIEEIRLGPIVPSAPFSEGEYYSIEDKNVTLECKLPKIPEKSYISFTFNTTYVKNMKTAVVRRRPFCLTEEGKIQETCGNDLDREEEQKSSKDAESEEKIEACTIALFDGDTLDRIDPIPDHLPPLCSNQRLAGIDASVDLAAPRPHLTLTISKVQLEQTGTYQCSVLRACNPAFNPTLLLNQEALAVSKSLFLKVYPFPDYRSDMVVASSSLAITSLVVVVIAVVSSKTKHPVDHL